MEDLQLLENSIKSVFSEDEELPPIEAPKKGRKRNPTPKQLEVLEKAREKMINNAKEKRVKKQLEDEAIENEVQRRLNEYKKGLEDKIIRKAIVIKKKEIIKQSALDEIEDDDIPMEKVKEAIKKTQKKQETPPPSPPTPTPLPMPEKKKYIFV
jgi:hypothetical protein